MPYCFITCAFRDFISFIILSRFSKKINPERIKTMKSNSNSFWILLIILNLVG